MVSSGDEAAVTGAFDTSAEPVAGRPPPDPDPDPGDTVRLAVVDDSLSRVSAAS